MTTRQERRLDFLFSSLFIIRERQNRLGIVRTRYFLRIKHDSVAIQLETQSTFDSTRLDSREYGSHEQVKPLIKTENDDDECHAHRQLVRRSPPEFQTVKCSRDNSILEWPSSIRHEQSNFNRCIDDPRTDLCLTEREKSRKSTS